MEVKVALTEATKLGEQDRVVDIRVSEEVIRQPFILDHHLRHGAAYGQHRHLPGSCMPAGPPAFTNSTTLNLRRRQINSAELYRLRIECSLHSTLPRCRLFSQ
jgi:hypothetical protein